MQSHDAAPCEIALLQHGGKATIIPQGHTNPEAIRPVTATRWGLGVFSARSGPPIPPGYYVIMIGAICSGFGLLGVAQGLRLLLLIYRTVGHF